MKPGFLAEALLDLRSNPPKELVITFVIGVSLLGLWTNFAYDAILAAQTFGNPSFWRLVIVSLILLFVAVGNFETYRIKIRRQLRLQENEAITPAKILITSISTFREFPTGGNNFEPVQNAIRMHKTTLQKIMVFATLQMGETVYDNPRPASESIPLTNIEGLSTSYHLLIQELIDQQLEPSRYLELVTIQDSNSAEDSYQAASKLLRRLQLESVSLTEDVILDITPGTKAMTVGLSAAAIAFGVRMEYLASKRDASGEPDYSAKQIPVELDVTQLRSMTAPAPASDQLTGT